jgi:hypothetical protein
MLNNYRFNRFLLLVSLLTFLLISLTWTLTAGGNNDTATVVYSTYIGGSISEEGVNIVVDDDGNAFVTGNTTSTNFPTQTLQAGEHGIDVFAAKLSANGGGDYIEWINAAALSAADYGYGNTIDSDGNMYVVGDTASGDFCLYFGAGVPGYDTTYNGNADAFLLKIDSSGEVVYCTFLGGPNDSEVAKGVVVDNAGNIYVTGGTWSTDFPGTNSGDHFGQRDIFLTKFDPTGMNLLFTTLIGGTSQEESRAIALHNNEIVLAGWVRSTDFNVTANVYDNSANGGSDGFIAKVNANSGDLTYATYFGGSEDEFANDLVIDDNGNIFTTGNTRSAAFPTTAGVINSTFAGTGDGFLLVLQANGTTLQYSTFLGGGDEDVGWGVALADDGTAYAVGETQSSDFPTTVGALDSTLSGGSDAYLLHLDATGSSLLYSTFWGGSLEDQALALTTNGNGDLFLTGSTRSSDFPVTAGVFDETANGDYDIFVTRIQLTPPVVALNEVAVSGENSGVVGEAYSFTAEIMPAIATTPITYTWTATGQTPIVNNSHDISNTVSFSWATAGVKTIIVTAENAGGSVTDTHTFTVTAEPVAYKLYLPVLVR